jgi:hypothetical protein
MVVFGWQEGGSRKLGTHLGGRDGGRVPQGKCSSGDVCVGERGGEARDWDVFGGER